MTIRRAKFMWKYRKPLWKYRKLLCHRHEIAGAALAGTALLAFVTLKHTVMKRAPAAT